MKKIDLMEIKIKTHNRERMEIRKRRGRDIKKWRKGSKEGEKQAEREQKCRKKQE